MHLEGEQTEKREEKLLKGKSCAASALQYEAREIQDVLNLQNSQALQQLANRSLGSQQSNNFKMLFDKGIKSIC